MSTIKLSTAYQLVMTSLLLGACLGLIGQQLPVTFSAVVPSVRAMVVEAAPAAAQSIQPGNLDIPNSDLALTTHDRPDANVQIEVEVHTTDGASALARATGPNNTEVKTDTAGEGHGRAVARLDGTLASTASIPTQVNLSSGQVANELRYSTEPMALIDVPSVNLRSAPTLAAPIIGQAVQHQQLKIVGRDTTNGWWLVCCQSEQLVWVSAQVVTALGNTTDIAVVHKVANPITSGADNAPIAEQLPSADQDRIQTAEQVPVAAQPSVAPMPHYDYTLVQQQQHGEQVTPRIFLYVSDSAIRDRVEGVANLGLRVRKDGVELATTQRTHGGQPDFTWPIAHERQHFANLKLEFPNIASAGLWEVQLVDADGRAVGSVARFVLTPNEPNLEMYLHYQKS